MHYECTINLCILSKKCVTILQRSKLIKNAGRRLLRYWLSVYLYVLLRTSSFNSLCRSRVAFAV